ncbi:hypothetical protein ACT3UJ_02425 [Halomonas sp. 86]|uniref:hypothetical protein n=1 Tax=unclassified Halomonas TaxID=2609666 RepID=UPI0040336A7C
MSEAAQQVFKYPAEEVFEAAVKASNQAGWNVKDADKDLLRITLSTGMSLFSWGENMALRIEDDKDGSSRMFMESSLKVGGNLAGNHRHKKNFDTICKETMNMLRG